MTIEVQEADTSKNTKARESSAESTDNERAKRDAYASVTRQSRVQASQIRNDNLLMGAADNKLMAATRHGNSSNLFPEQRQEVHRF